MLVWHHDVASIAHGSGSRSGTGRSRCARLVQANLGHFSCIGAGSPDESSGAVESTEARVKVDVRM